MDPRFREVIESLEPSLRRLREMPPVTYGRWPEVMPRSGVYLFSEGDRPLYVGRTRNLRGRLGRHCLPGATHRMASFAFRLARESTGRTVPTYTQKGSRGDLMKDPAFLEAFAAAKARIRAMDIRFVEEADPVRQTILEVYAAVALGTPYNDFDTH